MLRTGVPEATVDEDGNSGCGKRNVGFSPAVECERTMDTEPETAAVELGAKRALGLCVLPTRTAHTSTYRPRRGNHPSTRCGHAQDVISG